VKRLIAALLILCAAGIARADYEPTIVHVVAWPMECEEVSAAEFAIDNLPVDQCTITEHWNTDLVIGDLGTGISLAFSPALTEMPFYLGYLEFIVMEPLGDDYTMNVVESDAGYLILVDGNFDTHDIWGGKHIFNCSDPGYCGWICGGELFLAVQEDGIDCFQDAEVFTTAAAEGSWSAIKSLY
jgi:hypothetical protein